MDREQLLNGLYFVRDKINRILNFYEGERRLEAQFREEQATIGMKNTPRLVLMVVYFACGFIELVMIPYTLREGIFGILLMAAAFISFFIPIGSLFRQKPLEGIAKKGFVTFVVIFVLQFGGNVIQSPRAIFVLMIPAGIVIAVAVIIINIKTKKNNVQIRQINAELAQQYCQLEAEINREQAELWKKTGGWYPKNYYNKFAIDWFVQAVENYRCDTVKELVREYETSEYQRQMLEGQDRLYAMVESGFNEVIYNQEIMQQQLRFANVLSAMNIAATLSATSAVQQNTAATQSLQRSIDRNTYGY